MRQLLCFSCFSVCGFLSRLSEQRDLGAVGSLNYNTVNRPFRRGVLKRDVKDYWPSPETNEFLREREREREDLVQQMFMSSSWCSGSSASNDETLLITSTPAS